MLNLKQLEGGFKYFSTDGADKPAIVMIHAAFSDHQIFEKQAEYFEKDYKLILIDLPGHGLNCDTDYVMGDMPKVVLSIIDKEDVENAHFLGVSMGSLIVQGVAYFYPECILSVTIVGGYSIHKDNKWILKVQRKEMLKWFLFLIFPMKYFKRYIVDKSTSSEYGQFIFSQSIKSITRKTFLKMRGVDDLFVDIDEPMHYPLFLIWGNEDSELTREAGHRLVDLEGVDWYEIPKAGHVANMDNPEHFNEVYEMILNGKDP